MSNFRWLVAVAAGILLSLSASAHALDVPPSTPAVAVPAPDNPAVVTPPAMAPAAPAPAPSPAPGANYLVAPDDVLQLSVWGEPQMQGLYLQVTPEGTVNAPVVGSIPAAGRTVSQIRDDIARKFVEMDYLREPTVQLTVYTVHKMRVRVLGQVQRPGLQLMRDGDRLDQAIADAGSFIPDSAGLAKTTITRIGESEPIKVDLAAFYNDGDLSQNLTLKDGDTVYIPEDTENRFYVMGYVQQPRMFPLKPTTTVTEAISQAGGPIKRGALGRTVVIRKAEDGKPAERISVDVAQILETGDTTKDIRLQPGDVVLVPETKSPDIGNIGQILNALFNVSYLSRIGFL